MIAHRPAKKITCMSCTTRQTRYVLSAQKAYKINFGCALPQSRFPMLTWLQVWVEFALSTEQVTVTDLLQDSSARLPFARARCASRYTSAENAVA